MYEDANGISDSQLVKSVESFEQSNDLNFFTPTDSDLELSKLMDNFNSSVFSPGLSDKFLAEYMDNFDKDHSAIGNSPHWSDTDDALNVYMEKYESQQCSPYRPIVEDISDCKNDSSER